MKLIKLMTLLMVGLLYVPVLSAEENELKTRVKGWVNAYNTNDLETMTEFYEDSDKVNILISVGVWNKGVKEYKKLLKQDIEEVEFYDSHLKDLTVRDMGEFGVAGFVHKFKMKTKQGEKRIQAHVRTTMTLRKINGVWKVIQEHSSPILGVPRHTEIE